MATTTVEINSSTWTQVLSGAGFSICQGGTYYSFHPTAPTDQFYVPAGEQVNSIAGQILWAKAGSLENSVSSTSLA